MTPEDEEGLRRDGLCRTCGRACWPLDLTADRLCVSCCEKERDALVRACEAALRTRKWAYVWSVVEEAKGK